MITRIREVRRARKLTLQDVADRCTPPTTPQTIGRLEKAKSPDSPVLPDTVKSDAIAMLDLPRARDITANDYHVHRRPGEVMIARWLAGEQVETFYQRLQAHFDAALEGFREDERAQEWKQDPGTRAYLDALDKIEVRMAERYLRDIIRTHRIFVLSTQTADEMNIQHIADHIMGATAADIVGESSAPANGASESELAWFFKLFSLRGMVEGVEKMCFFTYMQKSEESW